jgi:molybdenum cofactor cytidylyltransferase
MRATVEEGLRWLEENRQPTDDDSWLLVPADHPVLDAAVIRQLLQARRERPEMSIIVPTHQGRRGHPTLISWQHVAGIRRLPAGQGLNVYLRQHANETMELPVESPSILLDLDTPEDYERLRQAYSD